MKTIAAYLILVNTTGHPVDVPIALAEHQKQVYVIESLDKCRETANEINAATANKIYVYECLPKFESSFKWW